MTATSTDPPRAPMTRPKLGEELPVFCEKCGYSLHGLTQVRCEHCQILHFHCPECGHHQPINTLRPAAQRIIGRLRATWLVGVVFFKLNFFGWLLFAWVAMGVEWSYSYNRSSAWVIYRQPDIEAYFAFTLFALPFGIVGRMLLLRWRRGFNVGVVLGAIVYLCVLFGVLITTLDRRINFYWDDSWAMLLACTFATVLIGSLVAWPLWVGVVRAFLPVSVARPLLEWQTGLSDRSHVKLASS